MNGKGICVAIIYISIMFNLATLSIAFLFKTYEIKCANLFCMFDFFYALKEKHCRSPPSINQFQKLD